MHERPGGGSDGCRDARVAVPEVGDAYAGRKIQEAATTLGVQLGLRMVGSRFGEGAEEWPIRGDEAGAQRGRSARANDTSAMARPSEPAFLRSLPLSPEAWFLGQMLNWRPASLNWLKSPAEARQRTACPRMTHIRAGAALDDEVRVHLLHALY